MDFIGPIAVTAEDLERVDPRFAREAVMRAQAKSWQVLREIRAELRPGITEGEARELALETFKRHGVTRHWHVPFVRFGPGTLLTFDDPIQTTHSLTQNDAVYLDFGPVWMDAETGLEVEGDVGEGFVFGDNPEAERCARAARDLFNEARALWEKDRVTGESLYAYLRERASELGYELVDHVEGHRTGDYPHKRYTRERVANLKHSPGACLWVLEVMVRDRRAGVGAFYEDVLGSPSA